MNNFDFFLTIDEKHHDEVYELIKILEVDIIDDEMAKEQEKALKRLEELQRLSA